jgi:hypothetical protein
LSIARPGDVVIAQPTQIMEASMPRRQLTLLSIMLLVAAIGVLLTVPAAAATARIDVIPVSFVLTPEQCPVLDTTITGSGEYVDHVTTVGGRRSTTVDQVYSTATGTAVDSEGNTYTFYYELVGTFIGVNGSGAVYGWLTDHFELHGTGSADGLVVDYEYRFGPNYEILEPINGNPNCDPI